MRFASWSITLLIGWALIRPAPLRAANLDEIDQFLDQITEPLIQYLKEEKATSVVPKFLGLSSFPSGAGNGFTEKLRAKLASHNISLKDRAEYAFVVQFKIPEAEFKQKRLQLRLEGRIDDELGNEKKRFPVDGPVTDPKTIAEWLGLTLNHGPAKDPEEGQERLWNGFKNDKFHVSDDNETLLDGAGAKYGLEVRVNNKARKIPNGEENDKKYLPRVHLDFDDEYVIRLYNWSENEVVVDLKIDGVNTFHFADATVRFTEGPNKGLPRYRYYVLPPKNGTRPGITDVGGWYLNGTKEALFKITPFAESAVAKAKLPADSLGMISATFHASWAKDAEAKRPSDEPTIKKVVTVPVTKYVAIQKTGTRTVTKIVGGKPVQVTEPYTYTEMVPVVETSVKVTTGFGREVLSPRQGVERVVGVERATLTLRYAKISK